MKTFQQFQEEVDKKIPPLPGLGGGGGGTDSITAKSSAKSFKKRVGDVGKILTRPFRKVKKDPTEKFATEDMDQLPGLGGGGGGTNAITGKSKDKTLKNRIKDVGKVVTRPLHKKRVDPNEKFAS